MEYAVDVKQLVKVYNGKSRALDGVDLQVETGKVFALLGPNGAGKTTLIRILTTQFKPTSGEARIFGMNVDKDSADVRKSIGYVPQEMSVWTDVSGYENLLIYAKIYGLPADRREATITDVLKTMGLHEVKDKLVSTYSGGMIRRLEIACIMLIKPRILFLDEPTIGLDPSARKAVWEKLSSFKQEYNATIFFNTHYMDEADQYADMIAIINGGRIVKMGTAGELKSSVGGDVITITADKTPDSCTLEKLGNLKSVSSVLPDGTEIKIFAKDAETALPKIIDTLRDGQTVMSRIEMKKPTLDDVFLKYAGTKLEEAGNVAEVRQTRRMIQRG